MTSALSDVEKERDRQRSNFDKDHDDMHDLGELPRAVAVLVADAVEDEYQAKTKPHWATGLSNKHRVKYKGNYRQKIVIAAAMLVAEIERLDRFDDF